MFKKIYEVVNQRGGKTADVENQTAIFWPSLHRNYGKLRAVQAAAGTTGIIDAFREQFPDSFQNAQWALGSRAELLVRINQLRLESC